MRKIVLDKQIKIKREESLKMGSLDIMWFDDSVEFVSICEAIENEAQHLRIEGKAESKMVEFLKKPDENYRRKIIYNLKKIDHRLKRYEFYNMYIRKVLKKLYKSTSLDEKIKVTNLLKYDDEDFVRNVYWSILGRDADAEGFCNCLYKLRLQELSKIQMIALLAYSAEGKNRCVKLVGFRNRYFLDCIMQKIIAIPIIGRIVRYIFKHIKSNKTIYQMMLWNLNDQRKIENKIKELEIEYDEKEQFFRGEVNQKEAVFKEEINQKEAVFKETINQIQLDIKQELIQLQAIMEEENSNNILVKQQIDELFHTISTTINHRLEQLESNVCNNNISVEQLNCNVNNNNILIKKHDEFINDYAQEDGKMLQKVFVDLANINSTLSRSIQKENIKSDCQTSDAKKYNDKSNDDYSVIDYFDFENHFRGSRKHIKKVQEIYLPYFENKHNVLDLGCGRGEFVELLASRGVRVRGVDLYDPYVQYCKMRNLPVEQGDAIKYLKAERSVDGIFLGQVVEHMEIEQIVELCTIAYEKLEKDCYLVMETPNPTTLAIYTESFYRDPSHNRPVHPETLKYIVEKAGFSSVKILYTESSRMPYSIPEISEEKEGRLYEFDKAMKRVSDTLYGSQDYAVIAKK